MTRPTILMLIAALLGGCAEDRTPVSALRAYLDDLSAGRYQRAYDRLTSVSRMYTPYPDFEARQRRWRSSGQTDRVLPASGQPADREAGVDVEVLKGTTTEHVTYRCVREGGAWKVAHFVTLVELADQAIRRGDEVGAVEILKRAWEIDPTQMLTAFKLSITFRTMDAGRRAKGEAAPEELQQQAIDWAKKAVSCATSPKAQGVALFALGAAYDGAGFDKEAEETYTRMLETPLARDGHVLALYRRALDRMRLGHGADAKADLNDALALAPDDVRARTLARNWGVAR